MSASTSPSASTDPTATRRPETDPPEGPAIEESTGRWRRALTALGSVQGYVGLILVVLFGIVSEGHVFLSENNLTNAVGAFSSRGILAVGETMVILAAGIDLSVGSMLGLASMASAMFLVNDGVHPLLVLPLSMLVGVAMGLCNGIATTWLRIQPFVVTLATLSIFRGLSREISDNVSVGTQQIDANGQLTPHSEQFQLFGTPGHNLFSGHWLPLVGTAGIYCPVLAFIVVCVVMQLVLSKTAFGRHIYAVGGNETAARLSGINVTRVRIAVFAISGLLAGFAGPIDAAYSASADPLAGQTWELDAIAATVIGGASLNGGKGKITGTFVGALILTLLDNVLGLHGVSANMQLIIKGLIVVVAVVLQRPDFIRDTASSIQRISRAVTPAR